MTTPSWLPGYYDAESDTYDDSRGGIDRARAAAAAIDALVPAPAELGRESADVVSSRRRVCLDLAGGTGLVSAELAALGWTVLVVDLSPGMLRVASSRLPGRVLRASADRVPVRSEAVELVTVIWMFNLVPSKLVDAVLMESARVLVPGGHLVATVDKELAHATTSDTDSDADARVSAVAAGLGLRRVGTGDFSGRTKWRSLTTDDQVFRLAAFRRN
jgi:SAM-dependent methyltransferase